MTVISTIRLNLEMEIGRPEVQDWEFIMKFQILEKIAQDDQNNS